MEGQLWRQYVIAGIANLAIASVGYCMGWTAPVNVKLSHSSASPLSEPVTADQLAWIGSLLSLGAIFGPFVGGFAAAKIGRKWGLLTSAIPLLVGFILMGTATHVGLIYGGRVLWGLAVGMTFTISPMYCAEIATDKCRGALGAFLQGSITLGYLLVYSIGPYISYHAIEYVGAAVVVVFIVTFYFMPESPIYHLTKNDMEAAARCLCTIRGRSRAAVQAELDRMNADVMVSKGRTARVVDLFRGPNLKALTISCTLVLFQQLSGVMPVLFYLTTIFQAAGSNLDPAVATIIIGAVQAGSSVMTPLIVGVLGRRMLMMISASGTAAGLGLLGMYFILDSYQSPIIASIGFLPILCLVLFMITYCWGLGALPWAIMGELFPIELKAVAAPIATAFCWLVGFIVARYFSALSEAVGMGATFLIFCGACVLCFFFSALLLPETKGKSYQQIQEMLAGKTHSDEMLKLKY